MKKITTFLFSLIFCIIAIGQTPVMTMTSSNAVGSSISIGLRCNASATPVQIDFGDGMPISYSIGTSDVTITKALAGSKTISIYGAGIVYLNCSDCSLTALNVSENAALTNLECINNKLTTLDITKNKTLTFVDCSFNKLSVLDVTQNTSLTYFLCSNNNLGTLDVSKNTLLRFLSCNNNNLTALNVSNNPSLQELNFQKNLLSNIDLSKNSIINSFRCFSNRFTFKSLPTKQAGWSTYSYAPQQPISINKNISIGTIIDLSDQFSINGTISGYTWKTKGGQTLVNGTDYSLSGGKTTFLKVQLDSVYCEITNTAFPDFTGDKVLKTAYAGFSKISMTSSKAIGSTITIDLKCNASATPIQIDFGNGVLANYTVGTTLTTISGTLVGSTTVTIYGSGIIYLGCPDNQLTALDVSKCNELKNLICRDNQLATLDVSKNTALTDLTCHYNKLSVLDVTQNTLLQTLACFRNNLTTLDVSKNNEIYLLYCGENQLTALDVSKNTKVQLLTVSNNLLTSIDISKNTNLQRLYCDNNKLTFVSIPLKQVSWTNFGYAPQKPLSIEKNTVFNTIIDLYSQLTVNGNTTVYTWKTKSGTTLVNGTDYIIDYGKTKFLKYISDSVYCELTNASFPDFTGDNALKTNCTKLSKVSQTITFSALPAKKANDAPFNVSALASSGLPVNFASSDPSVASINGATVTILKAGSITITATQAGNETWEPATASQTLNISKAGQTITFNALADKKANDAPFELSATASSSLQVTYTSSDPSVASISGNTVTLIKAGAITITATQSGNDSWNPATASQTLNIIKADQTITFNALAEKFANAAPFQLTASSNSGLSVSFTSSDPSIASISENTVTILKAGTVTITTAHDGNNIWNSATATQTLTIKKAAQTITFNALPVKNVNDASFELTASASSSLSVTFTSSDPTVASISGNKVTILKIGTTSITATQAGNDIWEAATISQSLVINEKQTQTITFNALPDKKATDASFELTASASSALPVTFTSSDPSVASISGSTVTILKAGTTTITATQSGNDSWNPATALQTLTITSVTAIGEEKEDKLSVYPNPAADILYIKGEKTQNTSVSIFNYIGSEVWSGVVNQQNINISQLPAGMYILKISNKDKQDRTIRFVKQ